MLKTKKKLKNREITRRENPQQSDVTPICVIWSKEFDGECSSILKVSLMVWLFWTVTLACWPYLHNKSWISLASVVHLFCYWVGLGHHPAWVKKCDDSLLSRLPAFINIASYYIRKKSRLWSLELLPFLTSFPIIPYLLAAGIYIPICIVFIFVFLCIKNH